MAKLTEAVLSREKEVRVYIEKYADLFDIDPNLIRGLITQESRFVSEAQSPTGAFGYGQFTNIGARQVQNISRMTNKASDLVVFNKRNASDPDKGIKAIFATLWWLFNKKYARVSDKKIQLEAVLTFYNAGGRPAALVVKHEGHEHAIEHIKQLPRNFQSQSLKYAPEVAVWFVAWHEQMEKEKSVQVLSQPVLDINPFDNEVQGFSEQYKALAQALLLLGEMDSKVDVILNVEDGLTEITLIFPGELE